MRERQTHDKPFAGFFTLVALVRVAAMGMLSSSLSDILYVLPPYNHHQQTAHRNHNADNKADSTITTRHTNSYSPL